MKDTQNEEENIFLNIDELNYLDYQIMQIEPDKIVSNQSDKFDGLRIIVEGECYVSGDTEKLREIYPDLMIDHRKPVVNIQSLKKNLNNLIIPSIKDHDLSNFIRVDEKPIYKSKYIRTLTKGDKIGDFEFILKLNNNLFKITNSSSILSLAFIPISSFQRLSKRAPQFIKETLETAILKCYTYSKEKYLNILFNNIQTKLKSLLCQKTSEKRPPKKSMSDFEATIKLYEANSSALVPSYISNSMNMMWKMKQSEEYWKKKILERKFEQEKESQIKINFFRSSHHQSARSNKALEKLKENETATNKIENKQLQQYSRPGVITSAKIPINHPSVASVWTVLKAVRKFKHNSSMLTTNKIAKSKSQIAKGLPEQSLLSDDDSEDDKNNEIDFDNETSDKNLKSIENRMKTFLSSLPNTSQSDGISALKRYVVEGKSIPQLGGTILVRYKQCNPCEEHEHIQHFILPKDALSTLQKYRASRPHTTERT